MRSLAPVSKSAGFALELVTTSCNLATLASMKTLMIWYEIKVIILDHVLDPWAAELKYKIFKYS